MIKIILTITLVVMVSIASAQQASSDTLRTTCDTLSVTNADTSWAIISTTTGIASYYAKRFEGRRTTSGATFKHDKLTCAHKTLPFGTQLLITNTKNNKQVRVVVNDRLPQRSKRSVDLTLRAANQLGFVKQGLAKVKIEVIK